MTRQWLVGWLLAGQAALAIAQNLPDASTAKPGGDTNTSVNANPAFTLDIDAPDDVKLLLTQHLELIRYQALTDLNDDELDRLTDLAQQDTRQLLGTMGYFSPSITLNRTTDSTGSTAPVVKITVLPGEPARVTQVQVQFTGAIATEADALAQRNTITSSWSLPASSRFTQAAWDSAKQQALRQLTTQRFPAGGISTSLADIDPDTQRARLEITLNSGPSYRTGTLQISGLTRFDSALVHRLARITPGTVYDQTELVAAQQRLSDSGYFDSAFVTLDTQTNPEAAQVQVKLREAKLQKLVFGVGASTDSGPRLSLEHTHHKVPGIGWRALSQLQLERDTQAIGADLTSPPDNSNWRWVASGLVQNQLLGTLDVTSQRLRGGRSQSGDRIDRNLYLQYDRAASVGNLGTAPVVAQSVTANYAFTVRYYDSLPFPSAGFGWGAEVGGGTTLGSEPQAYSRLLTRWHGFLQLGDLLANTRASASRLTLRATAAAVAAKDDITLPSTQLFLAGGDSSVRGYALNNIGIRQTDGSTTAGRYMVTGSVEWQRPIRINGRLSEWESAVFVDAGSVANQPSELTPKLGVGAGARWKSPVGPLQIDLAYGVDVKRFRVHMNLGFTF
jgi:translocation and assembly module TamA